jgi:hypothetical protein
VGKPGFLWSVLLVSILNGCGGTSPSAPATPPPTTTPPTTTLAPATLADLSATVTSPQAGRKINCRNETFVTVTLTNRALGGIRVSGVRKVGRSTDGCFPAPEFTYRAGVRSAPGGGAATVVLERNLYNEGSGCCSVKGQCSGTCSFDEHFYVVTDAGEVDAGGFSYRIQFDSGCPECTSDPAISSVGSAPGCPRPRS